MMTEQPKLDIKIDKPLVVFDIESTGANPRMDRIIELALTVFVPDGSSETHDFLINPEQHIPAESTAIHGITDQDVAECPTFKDMSERILELFKDRDLCGFGVTRFDIPILIEEFNRAGIKFDDANVRVVDALRIYHVKEPRNLGAALKFYCDDEHTNAHSADGDVEATIRVLNGQFARYPELPRDVEKLNEFCNPPRDKAWADRSGRLKWVDRELTINFGVQNRGRKLKDLVESNPKFLKWILSSDFPSDTKKIVEGVLKGEFPDPPELESE